MRLSTGAERQSARSDGAKEFPRKRWEGKYSLHSIIMAARPVCKLLQINVLLQLPLARELHLYQWPGSAARSQATWMWRSHGVCPGRFDFGALHRDCCPCRFPHASKPSANRGSFGTLPVPTGESSRESNPLQGGAANLKERRAFRTARMGRKLSGERGVGGAFGFPDQDTREDCTRTQNRVALLRKARPSGNDL